MLDIIAEIVLIISLCFCFFAKSKIDEESKQEPLEIKIKPAEQIALLYKAELGKRMEIYALINGLLPFKEEAKRRILLGDDVIDVLYDYDKRAAILYADHFKAK